MNCSNHVLFRVVRGVVRDVGNSHPAWDIDRAVANSITKRLVGTLRGLGVALAQESQSDGVVSLNAHRKSANLGPRRVLRFLGSEAAAARQCGNKEREQAFIDVLRFLAPTKKNTAVPRRSIGAG